MAAVETLAEQPKGPSLVVQIGVLAALSLMAAGGGWLTGSMMQPGAPAASHGAHVTPAEEVLLEDVAEKHAIVHLGAITTNLAPPSTVWVRADLSLVFREHSDVVLASEIQEDFLAYLRTVKLHQIDGPSGFRHLKSDLAERAAIRSEGKVAQVLIRSFILE